MKSLAIILFILLAGCSQSRQIKDHIPAQYILSGFDSTSYSQKGFLFTPEIYAGTYEAAGIVDLYAMPEANYVEGKKQKMQGTYTI